MHHKKKFSRSSNIYGGEEITLLYVLVEEPFQILFHLANILVFLCEKYIKMRVRLDEFESRTSEKGGKE